MNRQAIFHRPMSEYAYGVDENHVTFRIRTGRDDIDKCNLFYGDRSCRHTPVHFTKAEMKVVASDTYFDYFEVTLENPYKRINYYFELFSGVERVLYYGDCFMDDNVDDRSEYYQLPYNHRADIIKPPEWARDAIIYNIFPDSFATSEKYISKKGAELVVNGEKVKSKLGGTISGIKDNVGYLKDLGVNAIYINPIFTAGEYHKYDLIDYFNIDPCFGSNDEFKDLVNTFHDNGIRVIIDGVFNHCGWRFFAFLNVVQNGEKSKYKDWFYRLKFPVVVPDNWEEYPTYECFGYERMMPKLNTTNPEVIDYFCRVCKFWIEEFDIDGWRLDVASEVNDEFWQAFYKTTKAAKNDAILIGEVWETAQHWLNGKIFDSTMNYDFRKHCRRFFGEKSIDALEFDSRITNMRMRYSKQTVFAQLNLLDSHDVSRFLSLCDGDVQRYRLAILFQMTFPGIPSVFYGDEKEIVGIEEEDYRSPMIWNDKKCAMSEFFKKAIELRKSEVALRHGDYQTIRAKTGEKVYIYSRYMDTHRIIIAINMGDIPVNIDVSGELLWEEGLVGNELKAYGFAVIKEEA